MKVRVELFQQDYFLCGRDGHVILNGVQGTKHQVENADGWSGRWEGGGMSRCTYEHQNVSYLEDVISQCTSMSKVSLAPRPFLYGRDEKVREG